MRVLLLMICLTFSFFNPNKVQAEEVNFLLQSVTDKDKIEFLTTISKQNILYINPRCENCFAKIPQILSYSSDPFIIVVGIKPFNNVIDVLNRFKVPKNLWPYVYSDTGLRLTESLKITNREAIMIAHRQGQISLSQEIMLSQRLPFVTEYSVWQKK